MGSKIQLVKRNKNFMNYFVADIISGIGTNMSFIGINWFILEATGKSSGVGLFMGLTLFSGLISFIFSGTVADRYNRRNLLIFSNLFRGILIALIASLMFLDTGSQSMIFLIAIINGLGWGLYMPASRALIHELLEKGDIVEGNSILEISLQVGTFLAGAAGGFIYSWIGIKGIFAIDVITYLISVILLFKIKYSQVVATDRGANFYTQFSNGFRYLHARKILFTLGVLSMVPTVITVSTNVALPGYIKNHLHGNAIVFGFSDMSYGIGAFISGLIIGELLKKIAQKKAVKGFFVLSSVILFLLFANHFVYVLYVLYFILGLSNTNLKITLSSLLMEHTEKEQFGRAMSVWMSISTIMQVAFSFIIGNLMDKVQANFGYLILAIGMFVGFAFYVATVILIASKAADEEKYLGLTGHE